MAVPEILRAAIGAIRDSALLLSGVGQVLAANRAARDALALTQAAGAQLSDLVTNDVGHVAAMLRSWSRTTEPMPAAFSVARGSEILTYQCKGCVVSPALDGEPSVILVCFWLRRHDSPFLLLNQKIAELNREIVRRSRAEEELRCSESTLRDRAADAEALNRTKDEFLATLSHELRTPLNAILGWAAMLRDGSLGEDQRRRAIETIERNARSQAQLVEDMLDVSRIVTGKLQLTVRDVDAFRVVEAAIQAVRPAADAKDVELSSALDAQVGTIRADADRFEQICANLLSNAVKFTPKGGTVHVLLRSTGSSIEVVVSDTGRGIRADFLPYVFDRFRQQDPTTTRSFGGLGIGLSIVQSLVELHGGTVHASSPGEGRGSTFIVRLPRAFEPASAGARAIASSPPLPADSHILSELNGVRLVVVDDDGDTLDLMTSLLEQAGAHVTSARSAAEAFEALQRVQPDVLISDIGMPGEDGYSLVRRVRLLPADAGGRTPALAVTAFARAEDRARALQGGFQAHVAKPVNLSDLLAVVASLVVRA